MATYVIPLRELNVSDVQVAGGKGAHLGALIRAGFPVPRGVAISTSAFRHAMAPYRDQLKAIVGDSQLNPVEAASKIDAILVDLKVPQEVMKELTEAQEEFGGFNTLVSVRSSAIGEDGEEASFAGQYRSILGVLGSGAVEEAILDCWRSYFSPHAIAARAQLGIPPGTDAMGLIVQRLIDPDTAGVCFSIDPLRPNHELIAINAAWGLGVGVVDGSVPSDNLWLDRDTFHIVDQRIVEKSQQVKPLPKGGIGQVPVEPERVGSWCLPHDWSTRLAQFALAAEQTLGSPQDLEWAIAEDKLWILQSRPITGLNREVRKSVDFPVDWKSDEERRTLWKREGPASGELTLPLELDVKELGTRARADAAYLMGRVDEEGFSPAVKAKVVAGRRYTSRMPTDMRPGDAAARQKAADALGARLRDMDMTPWEYVAPEVIATTRRLAAFDPDTDDPRQLADHLEEAFGAYLQHWTLHWVYGAGRDAHGAPFYRAFEVISELEGSKAREAAMPLLEGNENILTQVHDDLYEVAKVAAASFNVARLLAETPREALQRLDDLPESGSFLEALQRFLDRWGQRSGSGYGSKASITKPTWQEDPTPVLMAITPYLEQGFNSPAEMRSRAHEKRQQRIEEMLARCQQPEAVEAFRRWLPLMRRVRADLENHNHYIDQLSLGQLRTAVMTVAHFFVKKGILDTAEDIFWLRRDEISQALTNESLGTIAGSKAKEVIEARKQQHQEWASLPAPSILGLPDANLPPWEGSDQAGSGPDLSADPAAASTDPPTDPKGVIRGVAAGIGRRNGRARIISMSEALPDIKPGEILVAENAGPMWTPVFPILGGLVLDHGALFQHAATTAREYGVPAVINTENATKRIPEGAWITVDGDRGVVEIHDEKS